MKHRKNQSNGAKRQEIKAMTKNPTMTRECGRSDIVIWLVLNINVAVDKHGLPEWHATRSVDFAEEASIAADDPYECNNCWLQFKDFDSALAHLPKKEAA